MPTRRSGTLARLAEHFRDPLTVRAQRLSDALRGALSLMNKASQPAGGIRACPRHRRSETEAATAASGWQRNCAFNESENVPSSASWAASMAPDRRKKSCTAASQRSHDDRRCWAVPGAGTAAAPPGDLRGGDARPNTASREHRDRGGSVRIPYYPMTRVNLTQGRLTCKGRLTYP